MFTIASVEGKNLESPSEETIVSHWESILEENKFIPIDGQNELRSLLSLNINDESRERILKLLNPLGLHMVKLSDERFAEDFLAREDSYGARHIGIGYEEFDATHGYYVLRHIEVLKRPREEE